MKTYVRNREEIWYCSYLDGARVEVREVYGHKLYDPDALFAPHCIDGNEIADVADRTLWIEPVEDEWANQAAAER